MRLAWSCNQIIQRSLSRMFDELTIRGIYVSGGSMFYCRNDRTIITFLGLERWSEHLELVGKFNQRCAPDSDVILHFLVGQSV